MAKQQTGNDIKQDEFSKIFDEYRAKIEEITRRTEKSLHSLEVPPGDNHHDEEERIEVVSASSQPEEAVADQGPLPAEPAFPPRPEASTWPEETSGIQTRIRPTPSLVPEPPRKPREINNHVAVERPPFEESSEILYEARREAKKIIGEAEESAKKDAKKRTQSQVDKIIEKARKEAEEIIARANRDSEKIKDEIIAESKRRTEDIIREITQQYRRDTEAQASRTIAEAEEKAGKMLADISTSTHQIGQLITDVVNRAKNMISELENSLQSEVAALNGIITETQAKLEMVSKAALEEKPAPPPPPQQIPEPKTNPTLAIRLIGEKSNGKNGTPTLFNGQMEMKSVSASFDYEYLKKLKKYLVHIPNIKYLQEYASEKEMSVVFDITEPLPLFDILTNIPMVDEVVARADDDICLVFKDTE